MRKTKLMALLLAALMVVAVFAGCASGVAQEDLDKTNANVADLADKVADLADSIKDQAPTDNSDVLDAIGSLGDKIGALEDKIENVESDLNQKIEDVKDDAPATDVPGTTPVAPDAAVKAAAQAAQAELEVKKGIFAKDAAEYDAVDYAKILEAFGAANVAINAATTVAEVEAAKAALQAELDKYMTYAMKAYDYYIRLLGNITEDAEDLVDEAKAFLKEFKNTYDEKNVEFVGKLDGVSKTTADEWIAEAAYLVSEGSTEARDEYIDVYTNIENLIFLYNSTSKSASTTKVITFVNEKGKIESETLNTLAYYVELAEEIVDEIDEVVGEELIYSAELEADDNDLSELFDKYDDFAEIAVVLGGEALVDLVENADVLLAAEEAYDNLMEAVKAYDEATVVNRTTKKPVFYYFEELANKTALEYTDEDGELAWTADVYAEVDAILADWIDAYDLSEENVKAIIEAKEGANFYTDYSSKPSKTNTYVYYRHVNALLTEACEKFADEIADQIKDLNGLTNTSVQAVLDYDAIEEAIEDLLELQVADKNATYPENVAIKLAAFADADWDVILRESGIYEDLADERIAAYAGIIDLFTFDADIDQLDDEDEIHFGYDDDDVLVDNRKDGDMYEFFTVTYTTINDAADAINDKIADLVEDVADNKLSSNKKFIELEGKFVKLTGSQEFESDDEVFTAADNCYVAVEDLYGKGYEDYMDALAANSSIEAFLYHYGEFAEMIDIDDFNDAKAALEAHIMDLFDEIDNIVDLVEAIGYVRDDGKAVVYEDANKNGKYDDGEEVAGAEIEYLVSLDDAAAVKAAIDAHNKWVYAGGSTDIEYFATLVDEDDYEYDDVYEMVTLENVEEISEAIARLATLDVAIQNLEKQASQFVAAVNNALAVHKATPIVVTVDDNYLNYDKSTSTRWWSWTKRTLSTADDAKDNEGSYTFVVKGEPWKLSTGNSYTAQKGDPYKWLESKTYTKAELLKTIAAMYERFVAANVEYKADADNDYEDGEYYYYQLPEYADYKAFDDAVKSYEALDLLSAKGYVLAAVGAGTADSFRAQIANATTIAAVENAIYNYNVNVSSKITATSINEYTIYDFDRLPVADPV